MRPVFAKTEKRKVAPPPLFFFLFLSLKIQEATDCQNVGNSVPGQHIEKPFVILKSHTE